VRDAVAVGEAAAAMPPDVVDEAVDVLLELPGQARLADAGHTDRGDEARSAVVRGRVEQVLDEPELSVAADERRFEPPRATPGEHTGSRAQVWRADLLAEHGDPGDEVERGAHRPFGIILLRGRGTPDGHHRVTDELLHGAAVALDDLSGAVEVARQDLARVLRVSPLGCGREPDEA